MNICVIGGWDSSDEPTGTVQCFNLFSKKWLSSDIPEIPHESSPIQANQAVVIQGIIYVVCQKDRKYLGVQCFDRDDNEWRWLPGMTEARSRFRVCAFENCILLFGGRSSIGIYNDSIEQYTPGFGKWTLFDRMPIARCSMCVAVHQGLVYIVGGCGQRFSKSSRVPDTEFLELVESFNPATREWKTLTSMQTARTDAALSCINGCLYIFGGDDDWTGGLKTVEKYCIEEDTWTSVSPMTTVRNGASVCADNGVVYVFGGETGDAEVLNSVECYDTETDTWAEMDPMPSGRRYASAVAM